MLLTGTRRARQKSSAQETLGTHLVEEVLDELDLVRDLCAAEDGEEGPLGLLEDLGKVLELLGHEEPGRLLREVDADHGRVGAVRRPERVVDKDVAELGEARAELLDLLRVRLGLVAVLVLGRALLLDVEAQVLEEEDVAVLGVGDALLRLGADALGEERDRLAREEALELGGDGLERVLCDGRAVGAAEVRHEHDRLGALVDGVLDRRERRSDALWVGGAREDEREESQSRWSCHRGCQAVAVCARLDAIGTAHDTSLSTRSERGGRRTGLHRLAVIHR